VSGKEKHKPGMTVSHANYDNLSLIRVFFRGGTAFVKNPVTLKL
jgi:hypothetical protein